MPKTPEQNGVAERLNRTLVETVRSMLIDAKLPHQFRAEALSTAVHLRNRSPTKAVDGMTPCEAWTTKKPEIAHLCVLDVRCTLTHPKMKDTSSIPKQGSASSSALERKRRGIDSTARRRSFTVET